MKYHIPYIKIYKDEVNAIAKSVEGKNPIRNLPAERNRGFEIEFPAYWSGQCIAFIFPPPLLHPPMRPKEMVRRRNIVRILPALISSSILVVCYIIV